MDAQNLFCSIFCLDDNSRWTTPIKKGFASRQLQLDDLSNWRDFLGSSVNGLTGLVIDLKGRPGCFSMHWINFTSIRTFKIC